MLSRHEQQQLTAMERQFTASDPVLADLLGNGPTSLQTRRRRPGTLAVSVLGTLLILLGTVTASFSLIFFGLVAVLIAACMHVTRSHCADKR